jgi:urea carboxylase-associated protein 2
MIRSINYSTRIPAGGHCSFRLKRGTVIRMTDIEGGANIGMLFYNSENLLERYNAPDTLKCQHTFKIGEGHCLYSDMGRIFASVIHDTTGWHDSICGSSHAQHLEQRYGKRDYQSDRNSWSQNGTDAFLVELAKYGLGRNDIVSNLNWFSKVYADNLGILTLDDKACKRGSQVTLRIEMDSLVIMHACPHPLNFANDYPDNSVQIEIGLALPLTTDDRCMNLCAENRRGFANNALYYLGSKDQYLPPNIADLAELSE